MKVSEEEFYDKYVPKTNHILLADKDDNIDETDIAPFGGKLYETFGPEYDYIRSMSMNDETKKHIWTIVENDDETFSAIAGFHIVNRYGFMITERPWKTGEEEVNFD